jgi:hypothetical protein
VYTSQLPAPSYLRIRAGTFIARIDRIASHVLTCAVLLRWILLLPGMDACTAFAKKAVLSAGMCRCSPCHMWPQKVTRATHQYSHRLCSRLQVFATALVSTGIPEQESSTSQ